VKNKKRTTTPHSLLVINCESSNVIGKLCGPDIKNKKKKKKREKLKAESDSNRKKHSSEATARKEKLRCQVIIYGRP